LILCGIEIAIANLPPPPPPAGMAPLLLIFMYSIADYMYVCIDFIESDITEGYKESLPGRGGGDYCINNLSSMHMKFF